MNTPRILFAMVSALAMLVSCSAYAQSNDFTTAISVNGQNISHFEIDQRIRMLRALGTPGNLREQAIDALIDERLFLQEAERIVIEVSDEELEAGMSEYAGRANLSVNQLLGELAGYGVVRESFEEFVRAGLGWRRVVAARFLDRTTSMAIDEIDQRLALQPRQPTIRVLLSELVLPLGESNRARAREIANAVYQRVRTLAQFEEAVRRFSVAESQQQNGNIGWIPIDNLPESLRRKVEIAPTGTVVPPTEIKDGIFVLFKRNVRRDVVKDTAHETRFSTLQVAGESLMAARAAATDIMERVNSCEDLLWEAAALPEGALTEHKVTAGRNLGKYADELENLDDGEMTIVSSPDSDGTFVELLVLCERRVVSEPQQREAALIELRTKKLEDYARNLLSSLREAATIR